MICTPAARLASIRSALAALRAEWVTATDARRERIEDRAAVLCVAEMRASDEAHSENLLRTVRI